MTRMLIDLADHVEGKPMPLRRKSSLKKRRSKHKAPKDRRVTWDESNQKNLLDSESSKVSIFSLCILLYKS